MSLGDFVITKLSVQRPISGSTDNVMDLRNLNLRHWAHIYAKRCVHCRDFHSDETYCFQSIRMSSRKRYRSRSSSRSKDSCSGVTGRSSRSDSDKEEGEVFDDKLKDFFGTLGRVDDKAITCQALLLNSARPWED